MYGCVSSSPDFLLAKNIAFSYLLNLYSCKINFVMQFIKISFAIK